MAAAAQRANHADGGDRPEQASDTPENKARVERTDHDENHVRYIGHRGTNERSILAAHASPHDEHVSSSSEHEYSLLRRACPVAVTGRLHPRSRVLHASPSRSIADKPILLSGMSSRDSYLHLPPAY